MRRRRIVIPRRRFKRKKVGFNALAYKRNVNSRKKPKKKTFRLYTNNGNLTREAKRRLSAY